MSRLCQTVLHLAKKQTKTKKQKQKNHQGTKPNAETSPICADSKPNLMLGPESEIW